MCYASMVVGRRVGHKGIVSYLKKRICNSVLIVPPGSPSADRATARQPLMPVVNLVRSHPLKTHCVIGGDYQRATLTFIPALRLA